MADENDAEMPQHAPRKRAPKAPSKYADNPYEVGKGKTPVATRFAPGNKGGGRKPGSRNKTDYEKLLDEKIVVGRDSRGQPIRKSYRSTIDRVLANKAAQGDLAAIKIVKDYDLKLMALKRREEPASRTPEEIVQEMKDKEAAKAFSAKLVAHIENIALLKREGVLADRKAGGFELAPHLRKAHEEHLRRGNNHDDAPIR